MPKRDIHITEDEQEAIENFPHLEKYIDNFSKEHGRPTFYPKLSRDMKQTIPYPNLIYPVGDPIFIHIYREPGTETQYNVIEPPLEEEDKKLYEELTERLIEVSNRFPVPKDQTKIGKIIEDLFDVVVKKSNKTQITPSNIFVTDKQYETLRYYLLRNRVGYGKLEPLFYDKNLEDIHCTGIGPVTTIHKIFGLVYTSIVFKEDLDLNMYIRDVSERAGRPASDANSVVDAIMPDGSRVNILYGRDVSLNGSSFTIRKFSDVPVSITQVINWGTMSSEVAAYMWLAMQNGMNVFVCGETASGKTTSLNAMCAFVKPSDKVYTVENTPEVTMPHDVWQHLATREAGRSSDVTYLDLLIAALRSRPNYIIVGEIRGEEGNVAFQAMQCVNDTYFLSQLGLASIKNVFNSMKKFSEPLKSESKDYYELNIQVPVYDAKENKFKINLAKRIARMPKQKLKKIIFKDGNVVSVTDKHKFLTKKGEKKASDLKINDIIYDENLLKEKRERILEIIKNKEIKKNNFLNTFEAVYYTYNMFNDIKKTFPKVWIKRDDNINNILSSCKDDKTINESFDRNKKIKEKLVEFDYLFACMKKTNNFPKFVKVRLKSKGKGYFYKKLFKDPSEHILDILRHKDSRLKSILKLDLLDFDFSLFEEFYNKLKKSNKTKEIKIEKKSKKEIVKDYFLKNKKITNEKIKYLELPSEEIKKVNFFFGLLGYASSKDVLDKKNGYLIFKKEEQRVLFIEEDFDHTYDLVFGKEKYYYFGSNGSFYFVNDTGHPVMSTFHAGSVTSMIQRITAPPINVPIAAVDNLNISLIQMAVMRQNQHLRRVLTVNEIERYYEPAHKMVTRTVFTWESVSDSHVFRGLYNSFILEEKIAKMSGYTDTRLIYDELFKRKRILNKMIELKIFDYYEVWDLMKKFFYGGYDALPFRVD